MKTWISLLALGAVACAVAGAPAQQQFAPTPLERHLPPLRRAVSAAWLDVERDGDLDVFLGMGQVQGPDRLLINDGHGRFAAAAASALPDDGDTTAAVVAVDVDADGDEDIVLGNYGQDRLYRNDGAGRFADVTAGALPADNELTFAVVAVDVDADGDPDLVLGMRGTRNRLYLNDGAGQFADVTATHMPADTNSTEDIEVADVDGDRDPDLLVANWSSFDPSMLYVNDGSGHFTSRQLFAGSHKDVAFAVADIDGDRDPDLAVATIGQNRLYMNVGNGSFTNVTTTRLPPRTDTTDDVVFEDVDRDGDADLYVANRGTRDARDRLYLNDGTGTFADATASWLPIDTDESNAVAPADADRDGRTDLLLLGPRNRLHLASDLGFFVSAQSHRVPETDNVLSAAIGDVDGDGDPDLLLGIHDGGPNRLYLNDGAGAFTDPGASRMPTDDTDTTDVELGDVDSDGDLDVVTVNARRRMLGDPPTRTRLYSNDGAGTFTDVTTTHLPDDSTSFAEQLALADFDGDGDLDALIAGSNDRLFLNDGTGRFTDVSATHLPGQTFSSAVAAGDVDGDGDRDVVLSRLASGRLYLNDGTGRFVDASGNLPGGSGAQRSITSIALADLDRDGDLDLVLARWGGQNSLYTNDGTGRFVDATARLPADTAFTRAVESADVDDDSDADLLFASTGVLALYLNDGSGSFTDASARVADPISSFERIVAADLDGDGDPDLAAGGSPELRIYANHLRQLDAPFVARGGAPFALEISAQRGFASTPQLAIQCLSFAPAVPRIPVPPFGALGLDPATLFCLTPVFALPAPSGSLSLPFVFPALPQLVGMTTYWQTLVLPTADPATWRLTNVTAELVVR